MPVSSRSWWQYMASGSMPLACNIQLDKHDIYIQMLNNTKETLASRFFKGHLANLIVSG